MVRKSKLKLGRLTIHIMARIVLAILFFNESAGAFADQASEEAWKQRFLTEAPLRWREYTDFVQHLQGTNTYEMRFDGKMSMHNKVEYKVNDHCKLLIVQPLSQSNSKPAVTGYNSVYSFRLARKDLAASWGIFAIRRQEDGFDSTVQLETEGTLFESLMQTYNGRTLLEIVAQPKFRVVHATPVIRDKEQLVLIEFDNKHELSLQKDLYFPIQGGTLLLDPKRYWFLLECDLRTKQPNWDGKFKSIRTFRDLPSNHPAPISRQDSFEFLNNKFNDGPKLCTWNFSYEVTDPERPPGDEEFTLSAFGLPEPYKGEALRSHTSWYIWFAVAGGFCLTLALGIRYWWLRPTSLSQVSLRRGQAS